MTNENEKLKRSLKWLLAITTIVLIGVAYVIGFGMEELFDNKIINIPGVIGLPLILIIGLIVLLFALSGMVVIYDKLELTNKTHSLGLPEGSVRAIIALSLILIFTILATFLYSSMSEADNGQTDFAKQILTTISTLVVAVAAFYFGTKAVAAAKDIAPNYGIKIISPAEFPAKLENKVDATLKIAVETEPPGMAIDHKIEKSEDAGNIEALNYTHFLYKRTKTTDDPVILKFTLAAKPDKVAELQIIKKT